MANRNKQDDLDQEEHDEQAGDEDDEEERRRRKKAKLKAAAATREDVEDEEEEDEESDEDEDEDEEGSDEDDEEEDPYWWTPHAVMGTLIAIGFLGFLGVFPKVFGPKKAEGATETKPAAAATAATPPASVRMPPKMPMPPPQQQGESIGAQHLLVMHKESPRAPAGITRTKEEAKKRAEEALAKLKKGTDFNALVKEYTDEPGSKDKNPPGDLGMFGKGRMVPPFEQAAFGLKPNETSGIVETQFGFHIIRRLKLEAARQRPGDRPSAAGGGREPAARRRLKRCDGRVGRGHGQARPGSTGPRRGGRTRAARTRAG